MPAPVHLPELAHAPVQNQQNAHLKSLAEIAVQNALGVQQGGVGQCGDWCQSLNGLVPVIVHGSAYGEFLQAHSARFSLWVKGNVLHGSAESLVPQIQIV